MCTHLQECKDSSHGTPSLPGHRVCLLRAPDVSSLELDEISLHVSLLNRRNS
jgi:hypothetical protein